MTPGPQHGLLAHPPQHLLIAALAFTAPADTAGNQLILAELREVLRLELACDLDEITATTPKDLPTPETGEVGIADGWDQTNLTIDVGFSASGYAALGYTAAGLPQDLIEVPWTRLGPLAPATPVSGDIALHIRADNIFAVEHALRRVEHSLAGKISTLWTLNGTQRYAPDGANLRDHGRALIGFHDGLSNLDPTSEADRQMIFVDPAAVSGTRRILRPLLCRAAPGTAVSRPPPPSQVFRLTYDNPPRPSPPGPPAGATCSYVAASLTPPAGTPRPLEPRKPQWAGSSLPGPFSTRKTPQRTKPTRRRSF